MTKAKVITLSNIRFIVTADNLWLVREDIMGLFGYGSGDYYVSPDYKFVLNKDGKVISPVTGVVDYIELTEDIHGDALQIHLINEAGIMQLEPSSWDCNGRSMDSFFKEKAIPRLHECQKDFVEDKKIMTSELIKVETNENGAPIIDGRELYEFLQVNSNYTTWFKRMTEYGFTEGEDFFPKMEESIGGRPAVNHIVSLDMAKEISMLQRNERGKMARQHFISIEKKWNSPEQVMARALKIANNTIDSLTTQIAEIKPLAEQTEKYIEHGHLVKFRELSKEMKIKETTLHMIVVDVLHWLYKSGKKYVPYKSTVQAGFMDAYDYMNGKTGHTGVDYGYTIAGRMEIEKVYADLQKKISA